MSSEKEREETDGVRPLRVLITTSTHPDVKAEGIRSIIAAEPNMRVFEDEVLRVADIGPILAKIPTGEPCALIWVGGTFDTSDLAHQWLRSHPRLVIVLVNIIGDFVQFGLRNPDGDAFIAAVFTLLKYAGAASAERIRRVELVTDAPTNSEEAPPSSKEEVPPPSEEVRPSSEETPLPARDYCDTPGSSQEKYLEVQPCPTERAAAEPTESEYGSPGGEPTDETSTPPAPSSTPLLEASVRWVHSLLCSAVTHFPVSSGETPGYSVARDTLLQAFKEAAALTITDVDQSNLDTALREAAESDEPLALAYRKLDLDPASFRALVLTLAPELDLRFQRSFGYLQDNMGFRAGSAVLYRALLEWAAEQAGQADPLSSLAKWRIVEPAGVAQPPGEPLRTDLHFAAWLFGDTAALAADPRVRRILRSRPWPGTHLTHCLAGVTSIATKGCWALLCGDDAAGWRAVAEKAAVGGAGILRVELWALAPLDKVDAEDCAIRLARLAALTRAPVVVDAPPESIATIDCEVLAGFLAVITGHHGSAALICSDEALAVRLLGGASYERFAGPPFTRAQHISAVQIAAREDSSRILPPYLKKQARIDTPFLLLVRSEKPSHIQCYPQTTRLIGPILALLRFASWSFPSVGFIA
jgi:hypothetical protein